MYIKYNGCCVRSAHTLSYIQSDTMMMEKSIISDYGIGSRWIGHTKSPILLSTVHDAFAEVDEGQSEVTFIIIYLNIIARFNHLVLPNT